ncbi:hypothetical protein [Streptomyces sp. NPDC059861]
MGRSHDRPDGSSAADVASEPRAKTVVPRAWAEWYFVVDLFGAAAMVFMP